MDKNKRKYRIFLSSPGDVKFERSIVREEVERIFRQPEFDAHFDCQLVSWDDPDNPSPLIANQTPQSALRRQLVEPADCDLVIVIFWSRMGTPLPKGQFRKSDGEPYLSGTEWEFENALHSRSNPNILLYRRMDMINLDPASADYDTALQQQGLVSQFFRRFNQADGSLSGFHQRYKGTAAFREQLHKDLLGTLRLELSEQASADSPELDIEFRPRWRENPYVGLAPYDEEHAEVFFGRDLETGALQEKLANHQDCIAVVGASGSGKSSLLHAGVLPGLKQSAILGSESWVYLSTRPSLADAWSELLPASTAPGDEQNQVNLAVDRLLEDASSNTRLVLFVDQAEEILRKDPSALAQHISVMGSIISCPRASLIITCRSDLYSDFMETTGLQNHLQDNTFMLSSPGPAQMIDIIRKPAQSAGIEVENEVVGEILESVQGNAGSLPLISFLLGKLYDTVGNSQVFDLDSYQSIGGVDGVITGSAEQVYTALGAGEKASFADAFSQLLTIDSRGRFGKEQCPHSMLRQNQATENLVSAFVDARLLTIVERDDGVSAVEIAHESLILNWQRLASLAEDKSAQISWRNGLRDSAQRWLEGGKNDTRLLQGEELTRTLDILKDGAIPLESGEQNFIKASQARRAGIAGKSRRLQWIQMAVSAFSFLLTGVALAIMLVQAQERSVEFVRAEAETSASAIAASLTQQGDDELLLELTLSAQFDTGNYQEITLHDPEGKVIIRRTQDQGTGALPAWMSLFTSIDMEPLTLPLQSGWQMMGTLTILPSLHLLRQSLVETYQQVLMLLLFYIAVVTPFLVLMIVNIRRLTRSVE